MSDTPEAIHHAFVSPDRVIVDIYNSGEVIVLVATGEKKVVLDCTEELLAERDALRAALEQVLNRCAELKAKFLPTSWESAVADTFERAALGKEQPSATPQEPRQQP